MNMASNTCKRCDNMVGTLPAGSRMHPLCRALSAQDWLALKPWFSGQLNSVSMGND
jgi:hypothetical protein